MKIGIVMEAGFTIPVKRIIVLAYRNEKSLN